MYGRELIIDLYKCDKSCRFNRKDIEKFLIELCELVDMQREDLHFWDYDGCPEEKAVAPAHLVGTSAVNVLPCKRINGAIQFITTSDIVIHTVDLKEECYINLFTCKPFNELEAINFIVDYFGSRQYEYSAIVRGRLSLCRQ